MSSWLRGAGTSPSPGPAAGPVLGHTPRACPGPRGDLVISANTTEGRTRRGKGWGQGGNEAAMSTKWKGSGSHLDINSFLGSQMTGAGSPAKARPRDPGVFPLPLPPERPDSAPAITGGLPLRPRGKRKEEKSLDGKQGGNMYEYTSV